MRETPEPINARLRDSGCTGKTGYLTWSAANSVVTRHKIKPRKGRGRLEPYRCRYCHAWHLGLGA